MAIEIVMPKLGWTMEDGILDEWIKQDGDDVRPGDVIFVVESDKALQEIEAFDAGILRILPDAPPIGSTIKTGELLAYLVAPGEQPPFEREQPATAAESAPPQEPAAPAPKPRATKPGRTTVDRRKISPRAKRAAVELGLDWRQISGSGRSGRIVERDVRGAAASRAKSVDVPASADRRLPMTSAQKISRDRLLASARATASVTLTSEVDASELVRMRRQLKAEGGDIVPSYSDLFAKLVAKALREHPRLNAAMDGDDIILRGEVHIGLAVDTERGLLTPVIRHADRLSLLELAAASADLIERTRAGSIRSAELQGGSFTITNLGGYGVDAFTPIINPPQCAILGLGRIVARQIVVDAAAERLAIRQMMSLSLSFDHRLVDGAPAAGFLQRVKQYVECPYLWLVE